MRTTFDVAAESDFASVETTGGASQLNWPLPKGDYLAGWSDTPVAISNALFEPADGVSIRFERVSDGQLTIDCTATGAGTTVGTLSQGTGTDQVLPSPTLIRLSLSADQGPLEFPIAGTITAGDVARPLFLPNLYRALLAKGTVTPIGYSFLSHTRYVADSSSLEAGDVFQVDPASPGEGFGIIRVSSNSPMAVNYRVEGQQGVITRYGGTGYFIDIPVYQRLKSDSELQGLWAAFVFVLGLATFSAKGKGDTP